MQWLMIGVGPAETATVRRGEPAVLEAETAVRAGLVMWAWGSDAYSVLVEAPYREEPQEPTARLVRPIYREHGAAGGIRLLPLEAYNLDPEAEWVGERPEDLEAYREYLSADLRQTTNPERQASIIWDREILTNVQTLQTRGLRIYSTEAGGSLYFAVPVSQEVGN